MGAKSLVHDALKTGDTLAEVFDAAPEAYLFADAEGKMLMATRHLKDFFDLAPDELIGQPVSSFAERIGRCFAEFMTYHEMFGYPLHDQEHEFIRDVEVACPKHRFLQVASSPVRHGETFIGRFWSMRDVTSDREIEELKIQYGGARGADELKSKFLTVVSHQLRTPLNSVRWNMELLLSGDYPQIAGEPKEMLSEAYKAVVSAIAIADDMLLAMDIEQRSMRLEKTDAGIGDILTKVMHDHARSAGLKGVTLTLLPLPKDLPRLFIDADRIGKVLSRLVDNAIKYTPAGGEIAVEGRVDKTHVRVLVRDTGIGIPEKDLPNIYERFYRSAKAIELNPNASGLGLYISKFIVDAHDGELSFTSTEGKGTVFTLSLPRKPIAT